MNIEKLDTGKATKDDVAAKVNEIIDSLSKPKRLTGEERLKAIKDGTVIRR